MRTSHVMVGTWYGMCLSVIVCTMYLFGRYKYVHVLRRGKSTYTVALFLFYVRSTHYFLIDFSSQLVWILMEMVTLADHVAVTLVDEFFLITNASVRRNITEVHIALILVTIGNRHFLNHSLVRLDHS